MRTIRLDGKIVDFLRKVKDIKRFGGNGLINSLVSEAVRLYLNKHEKCFTCPYHKEKVADIELGRQKRALDAAAVAASAEPRKPRWAWVVCDPRLLGQASDLASASRSTARDVVEQALMEHVTRPTHCQGCPFFAEMCGKRAPTAPVPQEIKESVADGTQGVR